MEGFQKFENIFQSKGIQTRAAERFIPDLYGANGFYGIVNNLDKGPGFVPNTFADTHAIWFDGAYISTSPLPNGKIRWDLILPDSAPPSYNPQKSAISESQSDEPQLSSSSSSTTSWESRIHSGPYPTSSTISILKNTKASSTP